MVQRKCLRYVPNYGYITVVKKGDGIGDLFSTIFKSGQQILSKIPQKIVDATREAGTSVASSTIKAVGSKIGDKIADKIVKKPAKEILPSQQATPELRKQILQELSLLPQNDAVTKQSTNNSADQPGLSADVYKQLYGTGKKKKIGSGIKILV